MSRRWLGSADVDISPGGALSVWGLIPTAEQDIAPIELGDDTVQELILPEQSVILLLQADAPFVEGQAAPDPTSNLQRDAGSIHSIPCGGRSRWYLRRVGTELTTVRGKLLLGT